MNKDQIGFIEEYRGYKIIRTPDDYEVQDTDGHKVTWAYGLKGARYFIDDIAEGGKK